MNPKVKKGIGIALNVLLWIFLIFSICITALVLSSTNSEEGIASINGKSLIYIQTNSMEPTILVDDLLVIQKLTPAEKAQCEVGDIVTFYTDLDKNGIPELNTHRVKSYRDADGFRYYTTKGDNPAAPVDAEEISSASIVGKFDPNLGCKQLGGVGGVMRVLQSRTGFFFTIVLPLILFFGYSVFLFVRTILRIRGKSPMTQQTRDELYRIALEEARRQVEAEAAAKANPQAVPSAAPQPEPQPEAQPEPQPEAQPEAQPEPEVQPEAPASEQ